jgi:toxin HigB-1
VKHVIRSYANRATERFAAQAVSKFGGLDATKALMRLQLLDSIARLEDIPALKSIGLHALHGDRKGFWAMTINGP